MKLLPRKEFTNDEVAETEYLSKPDPATTNASCQVRWYSRFCAHTTGDIHNMFVHAILIKGRVTCNLKKKFNMYV